jgi:hypothetical protein
MSTPLPQQQQVKTEENKSWWQNRFLNFWNTITNKTGNPPVNTQPQKVGGKSSKNPRKNRTRGGYVIKANSKSQSRRKNSRKKQ